MIEGTTIASTGDEQDTLTALTPTAPEREPLPPLVVTVDAFENFNKFNPTARDAMREFESAKFLWDQIRDLTDDDQARQDTFDGQTTIDTLIRNLMLEMLKLEAVGPGCDHVIKMMKERQEGAKKGIELRKAIIQAAMVMANWIGAGKGFKCDIGTVGTRIATATVDYVNEAQIPAKFYKRPDPVIDKRTLGRLVLDRFKALKAALDLRDDNDRNAALAKVQEDFGDEIPGCVVKTDGHTTTISFTR